MHNLIPDLIFSMYLHFCIGALFAPFLQISTCLFPPQSCVPNEFVILVETKYCQTLHREMSTFYPSRQSRHGVNCVLYMHVYKPIHFIPNMKTIYFESHAL